MPSSRRAEDDPAQVLACGIDTLYWSSACGMPADHFDALRSARERAAEGDEVIEIGGHALVVEPHRAGRYPVLLTCPEFSVQLTDSAFLPTAMVQLRSEFLHDEGGPRAAFKGRLRWSRLCAGGRSTRRGRAGWTCTPTLPAGS